MERGGGGGGDFAFLSPQCLHGFICDQPQTCPIKILQTTAGYNTAGALIQLHTEQRDNGATVCNDSGVGSDHPKSCQQMRAFVD